jgi:signal transduction histidine kinase
MGKRDGGHLRATRVIKNNAQAQAQLVADILDVSRIISGKLQLYIGAVDLREVIRRRSRHCSPPRTPKRLRFRRYGTAAAPCWPMRIGCNR